MSSAVRPMARATERANQQRGFYRIVAIHDITSTDGDIEYFAASTTAEVLQRLDGLLDRNYQRVNITHVEY